MVTKDERGQLDRIEADVRDIRVLLMGDVKEPDQPGLVERVRDIERFVAGINKLKWLLIGTLIASIATLALRFWPGA